MHRTLVLLATLLVVGSSLAQTNLRVFIGGQQRPDVIGPLLEQFNAANPGITASLEVGGATSDVQQQYLNTVLTSRSSELDIFLIDVVRPAQYAAAGWAEPLNQFFPDETAMMAYLDDFMPGPLEANLIDGVLYALPAFTDAQFLYYRTDLLERYGFAPPTTWDEVKMIALTIQGQEGNPDLQGFNYQGFRGEGTICTFLQALWSAGGDWHDGMGNVTLQTPEAARVMAWYDDTLSSGITVANVAEMSTDLSRQQFQAGNVALMLNWGYAWAHFQGNSPQETVVAGKVGVAPLPAFPGFDSATCIGGWQWAINPYSANKQAAWRLLEFLASPSTQRTLAVEASNVPARKSLYSDAAVLTAAPHFGAFYHVIINARSRPVTPFYNDVSEAIRFPMNAFFARQLSAAEALAEMQQGVEDALSD